MKLFFRKLFPKTSVKILVLLALILLTVLYTIPWIIHNALEKEYSAIDFHIYWYSGQFIRQGVNLYPAILNSPEANYWDPRIPGSGDPNRLAPVEYSLKLPIHYLDGGITSHYPIAQTLITVPAVTAPLSLFMGLFSWFSWPTARMIWIIVNLMFAALIPWMSLRLLDKPDYLSLLDKLIFAFAFYNFYGLRQSIVVGQQTLLCLFLLILALLFKENWVVSGVLLGFGISKYSVGAPVFIYLLMQRKNRTILLSILTQVVAVLLLIPLKWGSPLITLADYYKIITIHSSQEGVHLLARFSSSSIQMVLFATILLVTALLLARKHYFPWALKRSTVDIYDLNLIVLAVFLTTYHRIHDMSFMIFFLLLCLATWIERRNLAVGRLSSITLVLAVIAILAILIFPTVPGLMIARFSALQFIPSAWISKEAFSSISMLLMLALSAWLYRAPLLGSRSVESTQQTV